MSAKKAQGPKRSKHEALHQEGLAAYKDWDIELAVEKLRAATQADPDNADFHLDLARALSRGGDFDQALHALANFLRLEPESEVAERFEKLFASGLDKAEELLTEKMTKAGMPLELTGAAMQMWLEYRIAIGRQPLPLRKPETWAAALDYAVRKVNLYPTTQKDIGTIYHVSPNTLRDRFNDLVSTLDVMPCDYRYFIGKQNPLDKLVEAAELLEKLEERFREP
ncbi:MAG: tetratricopeptide repeat protein [Anaerolineae bacterium]|nr:tetratricopeptide repeat protein [Anaerolineae bacterium]